jgi:hypothetical protein
MTKPTLLTAGLIATAMLTTPVLAREHHPGAQRATEDSRAPAVRYVGGGCIPAPRVGAFATQPWDNGNTPCEPAPAY